MNRDEKWLYHYSLLEKYINEFGSMDGICNYNVDGFNLGYWVKSQRRAYSGKGNGKIEDWQIELLNKLNFKWDYSVDTWNFNFELLKEYYNLHKNINVSRSYVVNGVKLGAWLTTERYYHNTGSDRISKSHIKLLNSLEVDWNPHITSLLKKDITDLVKEKYYSKLNEAVNYTLDDLKLEDINNIDSLDTQKEIEKIIIKRVFR